MMPDSSGERNISQISAAYGSTDLKAARWPFPPRACHDSLPCATAAMQRPAQTSGERHRRDRRTTCPVLKQTIDNAKCRENANADATQYDAGLHRRWSDHEQPNRSCQSRATIDAGEF